MLQGARDSTLPPGQRCPPPTTSPLDPAAEEGDFLPCVLQGLFRLAGTHGTPRGTPQQQGGAEGPSESEASPVVLGECVVLGEEVEPGGISLGECVDVVEGAPAEGASAEGQGRSHLGGGVEGGCSLGRWCAWERLWQMVLSSAHTTERGRIRGGTGAIGHTGE